MLHEQMWKEDTMSKRTIGIRLSIEDARNQEVNEFLFVKLKSWNKSKARTLELDADQEES